MFKFFLNFHTIICTAVMITGFLAVISPAAAQQHAHTHGRMTLDVAIDAQSITLVVESPLESFLGFERAPHTDAEHKRVADMIAHLDAADQLFKLDPAAECRLSKVELISSVLGFGIEKKEEYHHEEKKHDHTDDEHANINVDIVFICARATEARFIDVKLFDVYPRIRTIDVQAAAPRGQFKRILQPDTPRLNLMN